MSGGKNFDIDFSKRDLRVKLAGHPLTDEISRWINFRVSNGRLRPFLSIMSKTRLDTMNGDVINRASLNA